MPLFGVKATVRVGVSRPLALVGPVGVAGIVDTYSVLTGKGFPFILEGAGGTVMLPDECTHLWIANKPLPPTRPLPPSQPFFCVSFSFRRLLPYLHSQPFIIDNPQQTALVVPLPI